MTYIVKFIVGKEIYKDILKIDLNNYNMQNFLDFFEKPYVLIICEEDSENNFKIEEFRKEIFFQQYVLLYCVDLDDLYEQSKELIYLIQISKNLNSYLWKLLYLLNIIKIFKGRNSNLKLEDIQPDIMEYQKTVSSGLKFNYYICSNENKLIKDGVQNKNYIYDFDKFIKSQIKKNPKNERSILTKSIKLEVFKKNNYKCVFCGIGKEETSLEIDHIIPHSKGGSDELDNLQTICKSCNLSKSNRIINTPNLNKEVKDDE
jgi:5-methylcytosine-specific restriction endonuclease McrA